MHRVSLLRSSGFRLSVAFTTVFIIAAAIAGAAAYSVVRAELQKRHERFATEQLDFLASTYLEGGISDLAASVDAYAKVARNKDSIFLLENDAGQRVAGNINTLPAGGLPPQIDATRLGIDDDFSYFVQQRRIGTYRLTVGASAEDISELEEIFFDGALWAALILLSLAIAGGIALSRRMNRRISLIQRSLERVAEGNFEERIAHSGNGDDIDTLADMMNGAIARLGALMESIRQISNDISHDLKTPLNRLSITIEEAFEKQSSGKSVAADLEEATVEIRRIIGTFDALLRIAQIESGARKARFAQVDLATLVRDVAEFYSAAMEDAAMDLEIKIAGPALIYGDAELVTQLFANLFENALRHSGPGTCVVSTVEPGPNAIEASLADHGVGIPEAERENVLRRLYRLESSRTTPGSGLGLSMVKAIADLHEAALILDDNHPGLRVVVRFPARALAFRRFPQIPPAPDGPQHV